MQETLSYRANFVFHYLNANNLYVWKRIQKLATHEFAWKNFMIPLLKKKQINCWKKTGKDILWKLCRVSKRATQKS